MKIKRPGKRERTAGKRHRRARIYSGSRGTLLKVGPRHYRRYLKSITVQASEIYKRG